MIDKLQTFARLLIFVLAYGCTDLSLVSPQVSFEEIPYEGRWNIEEIQFIQSQTTDGLSDTLTLQDDWLGTFFFGIDSTGSLSGANDLLCGGNSFEWKVNRAGMLFILPNETFNVSAEIVREAEPRTVRMTMDACVPGQGQSQRALYIVKMRKPGGGGKSDDFWNQ